MTQQPSKVARDNSANQLNPNHPAYHRSKGVPPEQGDQMAAASKSALDNHANQLNPNNDIYASSRCGSESSSKPSISRRK